MRCGASRAVFQGNVSGLRTGKELPVSCSGFSTAIWGLDPEHHRTSLRGGLRKLQRAE